MERTRIQSSQQKQPQQQKPREFGDLSDEYIGRLVTVRLHDGSTISGMVLKVSKYFVKLQVVGERTPVPQVLYLNKAYIVSIKP